MRRQADLLLDLQKAPDSLRVHRDESGTPVLTISEVRFQSLNDFLPISNHESKTIASRRAIWAEAARM